MGKRITIRVQPVRHRVVVHDAQRIANGGNDSIFLGVPWLGTRACDNVKQHNRAGGIVVRFLKHSPNVYPQIVGIWGAVTGLAVVNSDGVSVAGLRTSTFLTSGQITGINLDAASHNNRFRNVYIVYPGVVDNGTGNCGDMILGDSSLAPCP